MGTGDRAPAERPEISVPSLGPARLFSATASRARTLPAPEGSSERAALERHQRPTSGPGLRHRPGRDAPSLPRSAPAHRGPRPERGRRGRGGARGGGERDKGGTGFQPPRPPRDAGRQRPAQSPPASLTPPAGPGAPPRPARPAGCKRRHLPQPRGRTLRLRASAVPLHTKHW